MPPGVALNNFWSLFLTFPSIFAPEKTLKPPATRKPPALAPRPPWPVMLNNTAARGASASTSRAARRVPAESAHAAPRRATRGDGCPLRARRRGAAGERGGGAGVRSVLHLLTGHVDEAGQLSGSASPLPRAMNVSSKSDREILGTCPGLVAGRYSSLRHVRWMTTQATMRRRR